MEPMKILLIDDEESIARVLSRSLASDGHKVTTALSGDDGLSLFAADSFHIVLTDLRMPGTDGLGVLQEVKRKDPDVEVIVITGHGDMDSATAALRYGASDFINKPVTAEAIDIALERAWEKITIRRQLAAYTTNLEKMFHDAVGEVKRRAEFQEKMITSSNDGIVATDEKGRVIIFNPGAERIFGYTRDEVVDKRTTEDIYPEWLGRKFEDVLAGRDTLDDVNGKELTLTAKDGEKVPSRLSGAILYQDDTVIGSVGFFRDLREIKQLQQELVRQERLVAIGQTVARLAHYIKNILTGLKGGTYILNIGLDKEDTDKIRAGWEVVQRNIGRISSLVSDLLSYSKDREPDVQDCFPNEIVEDVCQLMEVKARESDIELVRDFDPAIGEVAMDPDTVHRTTLNLVSNAIDACAFDLNTVKDFEVRVETKRVGESSLQIAVTDNGAGMTGDVKEKLFTAFFSTKRGKGTGLGLLVTQKLIQENGGTINVVSQAGEGSTFTMTLPFTEARQ